MINNIPIPPAAILLLGAILLPLIVKKLRAPVFLIFPAGALLLAWFLPDGTSLSATIMSQDLILFRIDPLSRLFGIIFSLIALAGGIYSFHLKETGQRCAALLYAGGALGVTFAGDYFTLFMFWELMAVASTYLIWARRNKKARKAGFRYLIYHIFGGGLLFMGILLHYGETGSLAIQNLIPDSSPASWLILLGVAVNAAIPPLHTWLSDAYPEATVTGAVFLSAFTTKSAVYVLIRIFPGWHILLVMGVAMTLYGVIFAILANDIRRILAYHIISQVGYMVAGVGIGTEMALNGSAAHAFSHILYKALLFMGAGAVLQTTGTAELTRLGGLFSKQKMIFLLYMIAAFSISGFPLFNGFISKSMVVGSAGEAHFPLAMLLLLLASVGTFLSVGLKLPYFTWHYKSNGIQPDPLPKNMYAGMILVAALCFFYGIFPSQLYRLLPHPVLFQPYTIPHLVETVQIVLFTLAGFWLMREKLAPHAGISLDFDWIIRRPASAIRKIFVDGTAAVFSISDQNLMGMVHKAAEFGRNPLSIFQPVKEGLPYSPDRSRPRVRALIALPLLVFILLTIWGLIRTLT